MFQKNILIKYTVTPFIVAAISGVFFWSAPTNAATCTTTWRGGTIAQLFAEPFNVFTNNTSLYTNTCRQNNYTVTLGDQNKKLYIYKDAYLTTDGDTFSQKVSLTGTQTNGDWIIGEATANIPYFNSQASTNYLAFYSCYWNNDDWNCGCKSTTNCSKPQQGNFTWNLGGFETQVPSAKGVETSSLKELINTKSSVQSDTATFISAGSSGVTGAGQYDYSGKRTVVVTIGAFADAVENAQPGDIIEIEAGAIIGNAGPRGHFFNNIVGKEGAPIIITTSKENPATITSRAWDKGIPLSFGNSAYIVIENLILDGANNTAQQGLNIGGNGFRHKGPVKNVTLRNIDVSGSYNAGIKVAGKSRNVIIDGCKVHEIGIGRNFGEGIYIGEGNDHADGASDILIRNCEIYNTNAEAIDIKIPSKNITIENNTIHDINVSSQGAIVVGLNANTAKYNINTVIRNNRIWNVTTHNNDGNAIVVSSGKTWIYDNTIWNIVNHAIDVYENFNDPSADVVFIENNIIWTDKLPRFNVGKTYVGNNGVGGFPATIIEKNNIYKESKPGNIKKSAADFVGPITGDADAGSGPGSGFRLK